MNKSDDTQYLATVLAYTLPVLQFLFALLNENTQKIFLFRDYFVVVSVVTAAICYAFINLIRENHYFEWIPFQKKQKNKWEEWRLRTNQYQNIFTENEIKDYIIQNGQPKELFIFRAQNITQRLLMPLILFCFIIFISIGFIGVNSDKIEPQILFAILSVAQILSYMAILVALVIIFALFYYTKRNQTNYAAGQSSLFDRAIKLARKNNSFGETQVVSLLAHREFSTNPLNILYSYLITVGGKCYIITTDSDVEKIILINKYPSIDEGYGAFLEGQGNE